MTYWGILKDGTQMLLGEPGSAALYYDRDAPADLLKAVFPTEQMWEELAEVRLYEDGKPVFCGPVDEQNTRLNAGGLSVELVCRGMEALLLDNEASPGSLRNPSPELLQRRLLEPLGLSLNLEWTGPARGELTIEKGTSCWAVLERFCRSFGGGSPYVDNGDTVRCGRDGERSLELDRVLSAEISRLPCKRFSEIWQQSCRGGYDTLFRDQAAVVKRRRYLSAESGKNPKELLERGVRESFLLTVECAGVWWPVKNARASVTVKHVGRFSGCPVRSAAYLRDRNGERTRLMLERGKETPCG